MHVRLLDITRLMRRAGRVLTGVDRVEWAYLRHLIQEPVPLFGLARSRVGYILLDMAGLDVLIRRLQDTPVPFANREIWRLARKEAVGRVPPQLLPWMLRRHGLHEAAYLNVGHSNLTERVLRSVKGCGGRIAVLIHDVIPLEHPEFQRDGVPERFAGMLKRVGRYADLIICNSTDTEQRMVAYMSETVPSIVAHLGTDLAEPDLQVERPAAPYFVTVGTIEPRKNHGFLLDLWEDLGPDAPTLIIAGSRGWQNDAVFARLDALVQNGPVQERNGLSDAEIAELVAGANGLLMPSLAEGFGLPPVEAAVLGTPMILNDLPVYRETLGDIPIYASVSNRYLWENKVKALAKEVRAKEPQTQFTPPTWADHFKTVLRLT